MPFLLQFVGEAGIENFQINPNFHDPEIFGRGVKYRHHRGSQDRNFNFSGMRDAIERPRFLNLLCQIASDERPNYFSGGKSDKI